MRPLVPRRAVLLNDHLQTLGGGERSTLAFAHAFRTLGYAADVVTRAAAPTTDSLVRHFGERLGAIPVRTVSHMREIGAPDVFVNHSFGSADPNYGACGLLVMMFPQAAQDAENALASYDAILCNSSFTRHYATRQLRVAPGRLRVLNHSLGDETMADRRRLLTRPAARKRQFACVGRFNPRLHNKNQKMLIEQFIKSRGRSHVLKNWSLIIAGRVNDDAESLAYYNACVTLAGQSTGGVILEPDMDQRGLRQMLNESFAYVHGAGAFAKADEAPERCEHFGLSICEAMAHGCIPLVFDRGGIQDVLIPGYSGFTYRTPNELSAGFETVAGLYETADAVSMQQRALEAVGGLDQEALTRRLGSLLASFAPASPR